MPRGAEGDTLSGNRRIGLAPIVRGHQSRNVDQHRLVDGLARPRVNGHAYQPWVTVSNPLHQSSFGSCAGTAHRGDAPLERTFVDAAYANLERLRPDRESHDPGF